VLDRTGVDARPHMDIASSPASPKNKSRQLFADGRWLKTDG